MKYFAAKELVELAGIILCKLKIGKKKHYDLVIVKVDGIGDYIMWHDCVSAYIEKYGGRKVLYICNSPVQELAEQEDFFTEVVSFNEMKMKKSPLYTFQFLNSLKRIKADTVITPVRERHWYGDIFAMAISSKNRLSIRPISKPRYFTNYYNKSYSRLIDCSKCVNEIEANIQFTKEAILASYKYGNNPLIIHTQMKLPDCQYAVISFSTSALRKNWPLERFITVIDHIPDEYKIVLIGHGEWDQEQAMIIEAKVKDKERIINYVGKTTVPEMISVISKADFVIGNDSAAVHIAAAVHVPSIAIVPGPHFYRFLPYPENMHFEFAPRIVAFKMDCYNCNFNCIYPQKEPVECLDRISSDMVLSEMNSMLKDLTQKDC